MPAKIYDLDEQVEGELFEELAAMPQPLFLYMYPGIENYLIVSDREIDSDDLDAVAELLVEDLEDNDD